MPVLIYSSRFSPACRAVLMTAKQLKIDLDIKNTDLSEDHHLQPDYIAINPGHTIPTIIDDGFILWESRAIMQYLCNQYAPDSTLYPKDPKKRAIVDRWLNYDMSYFVSQKAVVFPKVVFGLDAPEDKVQTLNTNLKLVDQLIGDKKYLTGDQLTIADLSVLASTGILHSIGYDLNVYPNYKRWYSALAEELPYFHAINNIERDVLMKYYEKIRNGLAQLNAK